MRLSRKYDVPMIADFRDGLLFEAIESRRLRRFACVRKAYGALEARAAAEAAVLLTVSEPLSAYFRETYRHPRVETLPNGFDPGDAALSLPEAELEAGCFHVVHTGRFALSDAGCDIAPLVGALQELLSGRRELAASLRLHLLGGLSRRERRLLAGLARDGVVRLYGPVDRMRALAFQRRADLLLLVTDPDRRSVATTKIFEYLQARRPILALTGRSFAAEIIERTLSGWVVLPQDRPQISRTLERIILDPAFYRAVDMGPGAIAAYSFIDGCRRLTGLLASPHPR
jgi:glycosyltransferase involved in cell wall biosynthesis